MIHELTCVDTPQQNGVAERKNRHLLEVARALLFQTNVPKQYWGDAILTAAFLINRLPSRVLDNVRPIHSLTAFFPSVSSLQSLQPRVFGCVAFVHIHKHHRSKLDPRALKCIFLGYAPDKKGYKCYHPASRKIFVSMDVTFHESESFFPSPHLQGESSSVSSESPSFFESSASFPIVPSPPVSIAPSPSVSSPPVSAPSDDGPEIRRQQPILPPQQPQSSEQMISPESPIFESNIIVSDELPNDLHVASDSLPSVSDDMPIALRKGKRSGTQKSCSSCPACTQYPISQFVSSANLSMQHKSFISALDSISIPKSVDEALKDEKWTQAMQEEMNACGEK